MSKFITFDTAKVNKALRLTFAISAAIAAGSATGVLLTSGTEG